MYIYGYIYDLKVKIMGDPEVWTALSYTKIEFLKKVDVLQIQTTENTLSQKLRILWCYYLWLRKIFDFLYYSSGL